MKKQTLLLLLALFFASGCTSLQSDKLYNKVHPASVEILAGGQLAGSGWFAWSDGLVVTAAHVVMGREKTLEVRSPVYGRMSAIVVALDYGHDLALLRVTKRKLGYEHYLKVAPTMPKPGEVVYCFGASQFRHNLLVRGAIARQSSTYEYLPNEKMYAEVYHFVGPSLPGISGGCWINQRGQVIANQSGTISKNGVALGIAFGCPNWAIANLLQTQKTVSTPTAGLAIEELYEHAPDAIKKYAPQNKGLIVVVIHKNGPADQTKLKAKKSLIIAVNGEPMEYRYEFFRLVRSLKAGQVITLDVVELGQPEIQKVKLTLDDLATRKW